MENGEDNDLPDEFDGKDRSNGKVMVVVLMMVALGGIVVTLVSALIGGLS